MTIEEFKEYFNGEGEFNYDYIIDYPYKGLQIIAKYCQEVVTACEHDVLYSVNIERIADVITHEDALSLREMGWGIDEDTEQLYCYA